MIWMSEIKAVVKYLLAVLCHFATFVRHLQKKKKTLIILRNIRIDLPYLKKEKSFDHRD